ncbi:hypothetical protein ACPV3A_16975 [Paenibacillus sp. Dod16]|uniref:hypothetical protein n=1 Tax=Paenibacillus sp. Dod16 TaxID=3416392 RepID=UPI003CFB3E7D
MSNAIEIYICTICNSYCDGEECFSCNEMSGVLTELEDTSEQDLALIKQTISTNENVRLYLSSFGDAPGEIATIDYGTDSLLSLLQMNKFVFNKISSVLVKGQMQNCLGIAFLNPVKIQHKDLSDLEPIYGIMIFTE